MAGSLQDYVLSDFETKRELGTGSFGTVRQVVHRATGEVFAIKVMEKRCIVERGLEEQLQREVLIQLRAIHPNIVRMYHYFEDETNVHCLLEYADKGQLFAYMRQYVTGLPEPRAAHFFADTAQGLAFLHKLGVAHRDVKPENILLFGERPCAKLGDLGWCVELTAERPERRTFCGTPDYLSPEMWLSEPHDTSVDTWALGVLLYELLVARAPFASPSPKEAMELILAARPTFPPGSMSDGPKELILGLLQRNQRSRMPLSQVLQHPWVVTFAGSLPAGVDGPDLETTKVVRRVGDGSASALMEATQVVRRPAREVSLDETRIVQRKDTEGGEAAKAPALGQASGASGVLGTDLLWEQRGKTITTAGGAVPSSPLTLDRLRDPELLQDRLGAGGTRGQRLREASGNSGELLTVVDDASPIGADELSPGPMAALFRGLGSSRAAPASSSSRAPGGLGQAPREARRRPEDQRQPPEDEQRRRRWDDPRTPGDDGRGPRRPPDGGRHDSNRAANGRLSGRAGAANAQGYPSALKDSGQLSAAQVCFPGPRLGKSKPTEPAAVATSSGAGAASPEASGQDDQSAGGFVLEFLSGLFGIGDTATAERSQPASRKQRPRRRRSDEPRDDSGGGLFTVFG